MPINKQEQPQQEETVKENPDLNDPPAPNDWQPPADDNHPPGPPQGFDLVLFDMLLPAPKGDTTRTIDVTTKEKQHKSWGPPRLPA